LVHSEIKTQLHIIDLERICTDKVLANVKVLMTATTNDKTRVVTFLNVRVMCKITI